MEPIRSQQRHQRMRHLVQLHLVQLQFLGLRHRAIAIKVILTLAVGLLVFNTTSPAQSQDLPLPSSLTSPHTSIFDSIEELAPPNVRAFFSLDQDKLASAPVRLDGRIIFWVAAPTLSPDATSQDSLSANQRAQEIELRLSDLASRPFDPKTLTVNWELETASKQPVIYVNGEFLLTVTALDAQLNGLNDLELRAEVTASAVREALLRYQQERQPPYLWQQGRYAVGIVIGMLLLTFTVMNLQHRVRRRRQHLAETTPAPTLAQPADSQRVTTALRQSIVQRQKRGVLEIQQGVLKLSHWAIWLSGIFLILGLFPHTRWLQPVMWQALQLPCKLALVGITIYWLVRVSGLLVDRFFVALQEGSLLAPDGSQRLALRVSTFSQVSKSILASSIVLLGLLVGLSMIGVEVAPLLAGAGILGLAISFAAQGLIKDIINGFLILFEDQYGIGDVIVVGDVSGFVETMNLRITQLRNEEGRLITIPNSQIAVVQNLSKEWARVDLMVPIALSADTDQALALIKQTAIDMSLEAYWQDVILEPPLLLGIDQLDHMGATARIWIKTLPLKQWEVAREYRRRLKIAFERADIEIGMPHQQVQIENVPAALPVEGKGG